MKVIFLDFDGVLLTWRTKMAYGGGWSAGRPDRVVCALLERVCSTGPRIVVSSAWRDFEPTCKQKLEQGDLTEFLHEDWRTEPRTYNRPREIQDWLTAHPDVEDYRIIDDEDHGWTEAQRAKFLPCHPMEGMQSAEMEALAKWAGLR